MATPFSEFLCNLSNGGCSGRKKICLLEVCKAALKEKKFILRKQILFIFFLQVVWIFLKYFPDTELAYNCDGGTQDFGGNPLTFC